jgi:hypothetical protein
MPRYLLFILKPAGFILWAAGVFCTIGGVYGLFNHNIGDNRSPLFLVGGLVAIVAGVLLTYVAVKKDKKQLVGALFNDWFISLLWPW